MIKLKHYFYENIPLIIQSLHLILILLLIGLTGFLFIESILPSLLSEHLSLGFFVSIITLIILLLAHLSYKNGYTYLGCTFYKRHRILFIYISVLSIFLLANALINFSIIIIFSTIVLTGMIMWYFYKILFEK